MADAPLNDPDPTRPPRAGPAPDDDDERSARREQAREQRRERMEQAREATRERVEATRERVEQAVEQVRLTKRRLFGIDRSGGPPPQTLAGQPLNVWTIPNAIGFVRVALIPVFLVMAFSSESGTDAWPAVIYAVIAWSDYADGLAARLTGQYSRFGAMMDPVIDRLLVIAGIVVCWHFDLLPRWALGVLVGREVFMLVAGRAAVRRGAEVRINWPGRIAVWPTMSAIFFGLVGLRTTGAVLLYIGLALSLLATIMYARDATAQIARARSPSSSA